MFLSLSLLQLDGLEFRWLYLSCFPIWSFSAPSFFLLQFPEFSLDVFYGCLVVEFCSDLGGVGRVPSADVRRCAVDFLSGDVE